MASKLVDQTSQTIGRTFKRNCNYSSDLIITRVSPNPSYGICFTLFEKTLRTNLTGSERDSLKISRSDDPSDGLHLVLDLHEDEYLPYQIEKGFVLMIHNIADVSDVSRGGVWMPANQRTYVGIERVSEIVFEPL